MDEFDCDPEIAKSALVDAIIQRYGGNSAGELLESMTDDDLGRVENFSMQTVDAFNDHNDPIGFVEQVDEDLFSVRKTDLIQKMEEYEEFHEQGQLDDQMYCRLSLGATFSLADDLFDDWDFNR